MRRRPGRWRQQRLQPQTQVRSEATSQPPGDWGSPLFSGPRLSNSRRKLRLGSNQNLQHRLPISRSQMRKLRARVLPTQHLPQPPIHIRLPVFRQPIKPIRIDEVAQRIPKNPRLQIQLTQRPPLRIPRPLFLKPRLEPRVTRNRRSELHSPRAQQPLHQRLEHRLEGLLRTRRRLLH